MLKKLDITIRDNLETEKLHETIISLLNNANVDVYTAIGVLEVIKNEILEQSFYDGLTDDDDEDFDETGDGNELI